MLFRDGFSVDEVSVDEMREFLGFSVENETTEKIQITAENGENGEICEICEIENANITTAENSEIEKSASKGEKAKGKSGGVGIFVNAA